MNGRNYVSTITYTIPSIRSFDGSKAKGKLPLVIRGTNGVSREVGDKNVTMDVTYRKRVKISMFDLIVNPSNNVM